MARGGFQAPGTRINKSESEGSELKAHVKEAALFALAGDFFVFCGLVIVSLLGWLSVVPSTVLFSFGCLWFMLWFFKVPKFFVFRLFRWTFATSHEITFKILGALSFIAGLALGQPVWDWLTASGALGKLILGLLRPLFFMPIYVSIPAALMLCVFIVKGKWKEGVAILLVAILAMLFYNASTSTEVLGAWSVFAVRARYIAVPFVFPWLFSSVLLMLVTSKGMLFPYLDFNLKPITLDEVRELGLVGLWMPKLVGGPKPEPIPDRMIKVEVSEREGKTRKYANLPASDEFIAFCKSVYGGQSFALRTARAVGVSRRDFENIRDVFLDRGWAAWKNDKAKAQGIEVLVAGHKVLENIALGRSVN